MYVHLVWLIEYALFRLINNIRSALRVCALRTTRESAGFVVIFLLRPTLTYLWLPHGRTPHYARPDHHDDVHHEPQRCRLWPVPCCCASHAYACWLRHHAWALDPRLPLWPERTVAWASWKDFWAFFQFCLFVYMAQMIETIFTLAVELFSVCSSGAHWRGLRFKMLSVTNTNAYRNTYTCRDKHTLTHAQALLWLWWHLRFF